MKKNDEIIYNVLRTNNWEKVDVIRKKLRGGEIDYILISVLSIKVKIRFFLKNKLQNRNISAGRTGDWITTMNYS